MDVELRNELASMGDPPSTIRVSLTGKIAQRILLGVSIVLFVCWYAAYHYEESLSQVEHPDYQFNKLVRISQLLFFALAVLILFLFFYDVYIYNPWYRRDELRRAQIHMALIPSARASFPEAGPSGARLAQWLRGRDDLEPNHPLVVGLRETRERYLAMLRQKDTLHDLGVPPHQAGVMPGRSMPMGQFNDWHMEQMADD